jgi:hypothetical protein
MTMSNAPTESEVKWRQLQELLLGHLRAANVPVWPGADGLTIEEVISTYPLAVAAGQVPGFEQLLAARPDLQAQLVAFFSASN